MRRKFLEKGDIKLEEVREIAKSFEATELQMNVMSNTTSTEVHAVKWKGNTKPRKGNAVSAGTQNTTPARNSNQRGQWQCFRCGDPNHLANTCQHKNSFCNYCKQKGHVEKVCFKKKKTHNTNSCRHNTNSCNAVSDFKVMDDADNMCDDVADLYQFSADQGSVLRRKFFCTIAVEGKRIKFEFDSGAAVTVMSKKDFHLYFPNLKIMPSNIKLIGYGDNPLNVLGYAKVSVTYQHTAITN